MLDNALHIDSVYRSLSESALILAFFLMLLLHFTLRPFHLCLSASMHVK